MTTESQTEQPQDQGVLADLDSQATTSFYWYLAVLSCIGGFLFGYDTADIGSGLDFIPYTLSDFSTGYLVPGASIGAARGGRPRRWTADGSLRPQVSAHRRRRHLRARRPAVRPDVEHRGPPDRADPH